MLECDNCTNCKEHHCHSTFTNSVNYKNPEFTNCPTNCHFCNFVTKVMGT